MSNNTSIISSINSFTSKNNQLKKEKAEYPEKGIENRVSLHTYIRNQIHHRKENGTPNKDLLRKSIEIMRSYL